MPIPVSAIVVTKNPGPMLDQCLSALVECDQVLVVDTDGTEQAQNICTAHEREFIPYKWNDTYPKKRQWCLDHLDLKHDWIFFIDTDEIATPELTDEIDRLFQAKPDKAGYFVSGKYVWNSKLLSYGLQNKKIALFNRQKMHFPKIDDLDCPSMGEIEGHYQPVLKETGDIGALTSPLLHYANHSKAEWLERHQRYAAWEICMNKKGAWPKDPIAWRETLKKVLRHNPLRPELAFFHSYILKLGFLDGAAGFDFAKSRWLYYNLIRRGDGQTNIYEE